MLQIKLVIKAAFCVSVLFTGNNGRIFVNTAGSQFPKTRKNDRCTEPNLQYIIMMRHVNDS
jgi:hypothetical protein